MTSAADRLPPVDAEAQAPAASRRLAEANINPKTGLATDYLNHFNEAIMLLEMLSAMPDCVEDFTAWRPMTYQEHFAASRFKDKALAIAAYDAADPIARQSLDALASTMSSILTATREAMQTDLSPEAAGELATKAASWLKPLVVRAGAVINGSAVPVEQSSSAEAPQAAVDALFRR
ncbi:MAG TPA: hypothetical protein VHA77_01175 [Xanthobacteraceae bacterium]|jgi:hypothetical protein|nr:hypothetical protein [Xanthobacteraceae bacterium]